MRGVLVAGSSGHKSLGERRRRIYSIGVSLVLLQLGLVAIWLLQQRPLRADITPLEGRELFNGKSENGPALEIENDGGLHLAGAQPVNGRQGNFKIGFARRSGSELGTALEFQKDISRTIEEPLPGITEWMNLYPQVRFDDLAMLGEAVDDSRWTHGVSLASYTVAVKIFKTERMIVEDTRREMEILASVNHPKIVHFLGAVVDNYTASATAIPKGFAMEHFPGEQLECVLNETLPVPLPPFPLHIRVDIALQIALAMEHLHSRGIIHFDIKPEQFLVTGFPDGPINVKLIDFGIAMRQNGSRFVDGTLDRGKRWRGTSQYLAPEMVINDKNVTEMADVYGFGVVLWEMCSRRAPFEYVDPDNVTAAIWHHHPLPLVIPESCDRDWAQLIQDCMRWDPGDRPTFWELVERLFAFADELGWESARSTWSREAYQFALGVSDKGNRGSKPSAGDGGEFGSKELFRGMPWERKGDRDYSWMGMPFGRLCRSWTGPGGRLGGAVDASNKVLTQDLDFGEQIGEGEYGAVFQAHYNVTAKLRQEGRRNIMEETRIHSLVGRGHPHVVQFVALVINVTSSVPQPIGFVTERAGRGNNNGTLDEVLKVAGGAALPRAMRLQIAGQVASGLSHTHDHGVVHLGITASNVLLFEGPDGTPHAKIDGFGRAVCSGSKPSEGDAPSPGSALWRYMAPEVISGDADVTVKADVYGLGVLMLEMCGEGGPLAQGGANLRGLDGTACEGDWKVIVRECLRTDAEQRPDARDIRDWLLA